MPTLIQGAKLKLKLEEEKKKIYTLIRDNSAMDRWSVKARRPAPSSLQILFQGGVGCNEVVAADRGGVVVDIEREVDVRLDVGVAPWRWRCHHKFIAVAALA